MAENNIQVTINDQEIDEILGRLQDGLNTKKEASKEIESLVGNEVEEIKGAEQAGKRILRQYLPGARELFAVQKSAGKLSAGNITGLVGLAFLALQLFQKLQKHYEEQEQKARRLEDDIRQIQGFTREQYGTWLSQQKTGMNVSSYNRPVNR
jgi:hypothetical protein